MRDEIKKLIEEYSEDYCLFLEATYGSNMMSEGGEVAIERLFSRDSLNDKNILDIGFGLGGVAFYLAEKYRAHVSGVEINPWMVQEAKQRTPSLLQDKLFFTEYLPETALPFPDNHFDIVYSKGVLTHLKDKANLFGEVCRVLKPGGVFLIDDWLSPNQNCWGERLKKMCETEGITLYAETESSYHELLKSQGFTQIKVRDENAHYYQYNLAIVDRLKKEKNNPTSNPVFEKFSLEDAIECYQLIADSIKDRELLIRWFRAVKSC